MPRALPDALSVGAITTTNLYGIYGICCLFRIFETDSDDGEKVTEFGDDRVFNDLRYTINSDKLHALGWTEVRMANP